LSIYGIFIQKSEQRLKILVTACPHVRGRLLLAAMTSPYFWSMGAATQSTHAWVQQWTSGTHWKNPRSGVA